MLGRWSRLGWLGSGGRGSGERDSVPHGKAGVGASGVCGADVGGAVLPRFPQKENHPLGCSISSSWDGLLCLIACPR